MKELVWMSEAKRKEDWEHTSALMALVANPLSDKKHKPSDFNPYAQKQQIFKTDDLSILGQIGFTEVKN